MSSKVINKILGLLNDNKIQVDKLLETKNIFSLHSLKYKVSIDQSVKHFLNKRKKTYKTLMNLLDLNLLELFREELFEPTHFNVFGCPLSTDIDIAIIVPYIVDHQFLQLGKIVENLKSLGYDTSREIDCVQIVLDKRGNLSTSNKGSKETQNMIYYTYCNHKQSCPPIFNRAIEIQVFDKIKGLSKFILDKLEDILGKFEYRKERENKKSLYLNVISRYHYTNAILQRYNIRFDSILKSLCIKLLQTIIICDKKMMPEIYVKEQLGKLFASLYHYDENIILSMLTRGKLKQVTIEEANIVFQKIVSQYIEITNIEINQFLDFKTISFEYQSTNNKLMDEFYNSPLEPTDNFISEMARLSPERKLNPIFVIESNYGVVKDFLDEDFIEKHCDLCDQRSKEWIEKQNYFSCGSNTGVVSFTGSSYSDWIKTYYNLCRGSLAELMIYQFCDFKKALNLDVIKFHCGFLVEDKKEKSIAIAPDLLLIDKETRKIIPVEIKCIINEPNYCSALAREIKLARLQLSTCQKILRKYYYGFSLIVIMFTYEKDKKWIYNVKYNRINHNDGIQFL